MFIVWKVSKVFIRGKIIAHIKNENKKKEERLDDKMSNLEGDLARHYSDNLYHTICTMKYQLWEICNKKAEYAVFKLNTIFF